MSERQRPCELADMRTSQITRQTRETTIKVYLNLDGQKKASVKTNIGFMDHMLELLAFHGGFDLEVEAKGDTHVDLHHLVEDLGLTLGKALKEALGDKKGIERYGDATIPMDEALARVAIDISSRPMLIYSVNEPVALMGGFDLRLLKEFFRALSNEGGITLHIDLIRGEEPHHVAEAIFKAFGRSLSKAVKHTDLDCVPSSKGIL